MKRFLTILLAVFVMSMAFTGCVVKKTVLKPGTDDVGVTEVTVEPGTYEEVDYRLVVANEENSPTPTATQNEVEIPNSIKIVDVITDMIEGFNYYLIAVDGVKLPEPQLVPREGDMKGVILIKDVDIVTAANTGIRYTLRIENRQDLLYSQGKVGLMDLFNKEYMLTTVGYDYEMYKQMIENPDYMPRNISEEQPPITTETVATIAIKTGNPGKISPTLEYVEYNGKDYIAHWGYMNRNNFKILFKDVADASSKITSGTVLNGLTPPQEFEPGRVRDVYKPTFDCDNLVWRIEWPKGVASTSTASRPEMIVEKTDGVATANHGDTLKYKITVKNPTSGDFDNVKVTDIAPAGLEFVKAYLDPGSEVTTLPELKHDASGYWYEFDKLQEGKDLVFYMEFKIPDSYKDSIVINKVKVTYSVRSCGREVWAEDSTNVTPLPTPELPETGGAVEAEAVAGFLGAVLLIAGIVLKLKK